MKRFTLTKTDIKRFDKETAEAVRKLFDEKLRDADLRAQQGKREAAKEFMTLLTQQSWALRKLGYMTSDNRLVKFKPYVPPAHLTPPVA